MGTTPAGRRCSNGNAPLACVALAVVLLSALCASTQDLVRVKRGDRWRHDHAESGEFVRLIGVDTPETKHSNKVVEYFGREAAELTRRMVEGKRVRLEYDPANVYRGHKDDTQQKRTLAYVFLEDGTLLNAEIIRQGYGFTLIRHPFSRMEEFRRLEREAREQRRGLWNRVER